ncbi:thioredoxin domain-containing protein [Neolewinella agarilytica]|uniref:AhpC/TSA family protein n=1 Tax=Neolewinella agarilytica TaxID=478744 RepID=A0A1H9GTE0_9BACT|nr:hypothetical protein [Neolewinella agarilytica]SEQ53361.1 hypothetical protein SAMN05444359_111100 [Neolewinella agarilytica]
MRSRVFLPDSKTFSPYDEYGIVFRLTDEVAKIYDAGFDLHRFNGDDSDELPLAATYIIDEDGKIIYAFLNADYRNQAEPSELTDFLAQNTLN